MSGTAATESNRQVIDYGKRDVLGVMVDAVDASSATDRIRFFAAHRRPCSAVAITGPAIAEVRRQPGLSAALNDFDVVLPGDRTVRWALNGIHSLDLARHVPADEVVENLVDWAAASGRTVHVHAETASLAARIARALERRFGPGFRVTTTFGGGPPTEEAQRLELASTINATGAAVCLVALRSPHQERFIAAVAPSLQMPALGGGGIRGGQVRTRLDRRRLVADARFLAGVTRQAMTRLPAPRRRVAGA